MEVLKFSEMRLKKDKVVFQLPIHKIRSNPYQPRKYFNRTALEELADSIRAYGILQPITVRKMSGGAYELVAGERRLRAAELAGLETIPAILMQVSDSDSAVMAFIENIQRQNLSFLEEAEGYRNMMEDYGLTQEELAAKAHNYELERCESNVICVDYTMAGVGSNSCGPRLAEKYQLEKPLINAHFHIQISKI